MGEMSTSTSTIDYNRDALKRLLPHVPDGIRECLSIESLQTLGDRQFIWANPERLEELKSLMLMCNVTTAPYAPHYPLVRWKWVVLGTTRTALFSLGGLDTDAARAADNSAQYAEVSYGGRFRVDLLDNYFKRFTQ